MEFFLQAIEFRLDLLQPALGPVEGLLHFSSFVIGLQQPGIVFQERVFRALQLLLQLPDAFLGIAGGRFLLLALVFQGSDPLLVFVHPFFHLLALVVGLQETRVAFDEGVFGALEFLFQCSEPLLVVAGQGFHRLMVLLELPDPVFPLLEPLLQPGPFLLLPAQGIFPGGQGLPHVLEFLLEPVGCLLPGLEGFRRAVRFLYQPLQPVLGLPQGLPRAVPVDEEPLNLRLLVAQGFVEPGQLALQDPEPIVGAAQGFLQPGALVHGLLQQSLFFLQGGSQPVLLALERGRPVPQVKAGVLPSFFILFQAPHLVLQNPQIALGPQPVVGVLFDPFPGMLEFFLEADHLLAHMPDLVLVFQASLFQARALLLGVVIAFLEVEKGSFLLFLVLDHAVEGFLAFLEGVFHALEFLVQFPMPHFIPFQGLLDLLPLFLGPVEAGVAGLDGFLGALERVFHLLQPLFRLPPLAVAFLNPGPVLLERFPGLEPFAAQLFQALSGFLQFFFRGFLVLSPLKGMKALGAGGQKRLQEIHQLGIVARVPVGQADQAQDLPAVKQRQAGKRRDRRRPFGGRNGPSFAGGIVGKDGVAGLQHRVQERVQAVKFLAGGRGGALRFAAAAFVPGRMRQAFQIRPAFGGAVHLGHKPHPAPGHRQKRMQEMAEQRPALELQRGFRLQPGQEIEAGADLLFPGLGFLIQQAQDGRDPDGKQRQKPVDHRLPQSAVGLPQEEPENRQPRRARGGDQKVAGSRPHQSQQNHGHVRHPHRHPEGHHEVDSENVGTQKDPAQNQAEIHAPFPLPGFRHAPEFLGY